MISAADEKNSFGYYIPAFDQPQVSMADLLDLHYKQAAIDELHSESKEDCRCGHHPYSATHLEPAHPEPQSTSNRRKMIKQVLLLALLVAAILQVAREQGAFRSWEGPTSAFWVEVIESSGPEVSSDEHRLFGVGQ